MKLVFFPAALLAVLSSPVNADIEINLDNYYAAGNIYVFEDLKNVAWLLGEIMLDDYFNLREIIRKYEIDTLIMDSPGGDLYEGLYMAAVLHDRGINTYIPTQGYCESSCANMFFAGRSRVANGNLGVHQFSSDRSLEEQELTQVTVADIISFLNEFTTPPIVFEKMFLSEDIYYFSSDEINIINRQTDFFSSEDFRFYDNLFVEIIDIFYVSEQPLGKANEPDESNYVGGDEKQIIDFEFLAVMAALNENVLDVEIFCGGPSVLPPNALFFYSTAISDRGAGGNINGFVFNGSSIGENSEGGYSINGMIEKSERWEAYPYKISFNINGRAAETAGLVNYDFEWLGNLDQDSSDASALTFTALQQDGASCTMQFFIGGL